MTEMFLQTLHSFPWPFLGCSLFQWYFTLKNGPLFRRCFSTPKNLIESIKVQLQCLLFPSASAFLTGGELSCIWITVTIYIHCTRIISCFMDDFFLFLLHKRSMVLNQGMMPHLYPRCTWQTFLVVMLWGCHWSRDRGWQTPHNTRAAPHNTELSSPRC